MEGGPSSTNFLVTRSWFLTFWTSSLPEVPLLLDFLLRELPLPLPHVSVGHQHSSSVTGSQTSRTTSLQAGPAARAPPAAHSWFPWWAAACVKPHPAGAQRCRTSSSAFPSQPANAALSCSLLARTSTSRSILYESGLDHSL